MKIRRKKVWFLVPLTLILVVTITLGTLFYMGGMGLLIELCNTIDRTDMMEAKEYHDPNGTALAYRIYVPKNYDSAKAYPLVLYLHGAGERGDDNRAQSSKNSVMQTLLNEENLAAYPCIVLAPQCPQEQRWSATISLLEDAKADTGNEKLVALMGLMEQTQNEYSIDRARIYITGVSMGGYGTWSMLAQYPAYFAAAVPVCGGGDAALAKTYKDVPI